MAVDLRDTVPIPQPKGYPLIGNVLEVMGDVPIMALANLGKQYGEIFRLNIVGQNSAFVSSHALTNELCDEKRFQKLVSSSLAELREGVADGLFTAHDHETNWETAHRTLVPAFGPMNIKDM